MTVQLPLELDERQAEIVLGWLKEGRVLYWPNVDLSMAGGYFLSKEAEGTSPPHWRAARQPEASIFSVTAFEVVTRKEVKRFRVALRRGRQGLVVKLTDKSSERLRREVDKAQGSYYFDYSTQEAVITVRDKCVPLNEWALSRKE